MPKKKQRTFNGGLWTEGRFNSFITSILRSGSRRWGPKYSTLNEAKTEKKINVKSGRMAQHFLCAKCDKEHVAKDVQVDHIKPIGFDKTWDEFINGLYCEADNLQVLCVGCHSLKTKEERKRI
jgi:5-methylcytosine-specific restriction endonuclease McrA